MECDSVHATIDCVVKKAKIYAPTDHYRAVSMTRRSNPYQVAMMNHFRPLAKNISFKIATVILKSVG